LCEAAKALKMHGAKSINVFATHGLFSGDAFKNIEESVLQKVVVTNTIPSKPGEEKNEKIVRLSVAALLAETIYRV